MRKNKYANYSTKSLRWMIQDLQERGKGKSVKIDKILTELGTRNDKDEKTD